ncbi:aldehyde-activating protein [Solimonas fluminis]|uniref:Aldehyde-activating protein n=1 Tax=Solimonas fluminis TaxID=2086571 RepID=A0A2S5TAI5_9GAMM|nr:GFA family protein [Solimonas fluminis]PPE71972.1 aldehyde-activating protein [Solimonas fluminis]
MPTTTYHGSCHCGAVRYEADIDLAAGTSKCNCSICSKARHWGTSVKPEAFRLLSGEDALRDYQFNSRSMHHLFCGSCGMRPFGRGDIPELGGAFVSINLACLDDLDPAVLAESPVTYCNGRDNDWWHAPKEVRHL